MMTRVGMCPGCEVVLQADGGSVILREQGVALVRCPRCALVFSDPVPGYGELADHYDQAYADNDVDEYERSPDRAFQGYRRLLRRHLAAGSRVLDVGACFGGFIAATGRVVGQEIVAVAKAG